MPKTRMVGQTVPRWTGGAAEEALDREGEGSLDRLGLLGSGLDSEGEEDGLLEAEGGGVGVGVDEPSLGTQIPPRLISKFGSMHSQV